MFRTRRLMLVQVRKEEAGLVVRVSALFALCGIAMTLAANTKDGLFLDRVGAEHLPPMYVALGIVSFLFLMAYTSGLKRFADRRIVFAVSVPVALAVVVLGERGLLLLKMGTAVVPVVWLTVEVITAFMLLISWNISGEVNDTLQAKRLFPVYVSAAVAGRFTGNAITSPLNLLLGTENLLIVYAVVVLLAAGLIYTITRRYAPPRPRQVVAAGLLDDLREGFAAIRQTPLLKLVAYATVVNATLAFMVSFLFNTAVQDAIPTDRAGFLGQFYTVTTVVIFIVSFFLASRLYARLGLVNSFLILPASYLAVSILLAVNRTILPASIAQFVKFIALYAVADGALNAIFNVIPATSRGQVRTFNSAVAQQVGIVLSGLFIILTQLLLSPDQVVILGLGLAVTGCVLVWRMHGEYGDALVQALKAGRFEVFTADEGSLFARFEGHAGAIELAINTLHDDQPAQRVLGANLLALMHARSAVPALMAAAEDPDAEVRSEVINALAELGAQEAAGVIQSRLGDEDYRVRVAALSALPQVAPEASDILIQEIRLLLRDDAIEVSAQAAVALALYGETERGMGRLKSLLGDVRSNRRVIAVQAIGQLARAGVEANACLAALVDALGDPAAFVRRVACETLGELGVESAIDPLVARLGDPEKVVQSAASAALRSMGRAATEKVLPVLLEPVSGRIGATPDEAARLDAALDALDPDTPGLIEALFEYVDQEVARLHTLRELHAALAFEETKLDLVCQELTLREDRAEARLVKSVGLFGDRKAMSLVAEALHSDDPQLRASSVETLETLGSRELVKRILPHLEEAEEARHIDARGETLTPTAAVERLLVDGDHWLRALAAYAVAEMDLSDLSGRLDAMKADPDPLIAEAVQGALRRMVKGGDMTHEKTRTVSALERTILLKQVPLFEGLDLDDLKQIADIAREQWHDDRSVIYHEGDQGDEMMLIIEGQVRIYTRSDEEKVTLATPGEGEVVGEMALLDSAPRSASVEATGRLHVLIIEREPFLAILRERPEVSLKLMRSLTRRLREMIAAGTG